MTSKQDNRRKPKPRETSNCRWISSGFENYLADLSNNDIAGSPDKPIDFLIIGSGYGAAIAARELSSQFAQTSSSDDSTPSDQSHENDQSVSREIVIFERGEEYLPGSFPDKFSELPTHLRISPTPDDKPIGTSSGLFDLRTSKHINCLVANGLGGGSLINAGVMRRPPAHAFKEHWPDNITAQSLEPYFDQVEVLLGSHYRDKVNQKNIPISVDLQSELDDHSKTRILDQQVKHINTNTEHSTDRFSFESAAITVAQKSGANQSGVYLDKCINCADCATGCNHNAKNSLDVNLLYEAHTMGATIVTGVTALKIAKVEQNTGSNLWVAQCRYTNDKLFKREPGSHPDQPGINHVYAKNILICCGALGSTELLHNSSSTQLQFSKTLGSGFSGNGDLLTFYPTHTLSESIRPKSSARETQCPKERHIGPTIGGVVSIDSTASDGSESTVLIEEMAIPGTIRPVFEESIEFAQYVRHSFKRDKHRQKGNSQRVDAHDVDHTGIYASIGDDKSQGQLLPVKPTRTDADPTDGRLRIIWGNQNDDASLNDENNDEENENFESIDTLFQTQTTFINKFFEQKDDKTQLLPNPMWRIFRPIGPLIEKIFDDVDRPKVAMSVHPLGGCRMADTQDTGVTDEFGRVFDGSGENTVHDGLYVLDGSIVPKALSANPALTISALALRAMDKLLSEHGFNGIEKNSSAAPAALSNTDKLQITPDSEKIAREKVSQRLNTRSDSSRFTLLERLTGQLEFKHKDQKHSLFAELTIRTEPKSLREFSDSTHFKDKDNDSFVASSQWDHRGYTTMLRLYASKADYDQAEQNALLTRPILNRDEWQDETGFMASVMEKQNDWEKHLSANAVAIVKLSGKIRVLHQKSFDWINRTKSIGRNITSLAGILIKTRSITLAWNATKSLYLTYTLSPVAIACRTTANSDINNLLETVIKKDFQRAINSGKAKSIVVGEKRVHASKANVIVRQLSEIRINKFPGLFESRLSKWNLIKDDSNQLLLDPKLLASTGHPLLAIDNQNNLINSFSDLASFGIFCIKKLLPVHLLPLLSAYQNNTYFKSDSSKIDRAPGSLEISTSADSDNGRDTTRRAAESTAYQLEVPTHLASLPTGASTQTDDKALVTIGLTHYRADVGNTREHKEPLLMIHGYCAGANTYTHESINTPLAVPLLEAGHDVWVLDMRDSCRYYNQALLYWTFEQVAMIDIRAAIDFVHKTTGQEKLGVVGHCIGSAKFSLLMLSSKEQCEPFDYYSYEINQHSGNLAITDSDKVNKEKHAVDIARHPSEKISRAVLSQVTPILNVSDGNLLRAYMLDNWFKATTLITANLEETDFPGFELQPGTKTGKNSTLIDKIIDTALQTLPYPYDQDDPRMTDETFSEAMLTRRRLDILYNKVFQLKHTTSKTLLALNEIFGPVNLQTLLQGVHFARERRITNYLGEGVSFNNNQLLQRLKQQWTFPTYCFIGAENQVFDADGFNLFQQLAYRNELNNFQFAKPIADYGHQDVFIGKNAHNDVYPLILDWLNNGNLVSTTTTATTTVTTTATATTPTKGSTANRASLLNQQNTYRSIHKIIHSNIRPDPEGLTITLRLSDIPASITHLRLAAKEHKTSEPIAQCDIAYSINNQPTQDEQEENGQRQQASNTEHGPVTQAPCNPEKYGSVDISTDETSVHIQLSKDTHADFFDSQGHMRAIDIDFKADYFAALPLE